MRAAGFEPTIPAIDRPQTHAIDRAATRIGDLPRLEYVYLITYFHVILTFQ